MAKRKTLIAKCRFQFDAILVQNIKLQPEPTTYRNRVFVRWPQKGIFAGEVSLIPETNLRGAI